MAVPEVEEFAKLLMRHVRDEAIASCDLSRNPNSNSVEAKRWRQKMESGRTDELLAEIIPDCVDSTLFYLLHAIDEGLLQVSFRSRTGRMVDLVEAGESEMAGWCACGGTDDWRARFSKERFNDNLRDLD
jgi:hypothetical protein